MEFKSGDIVQVTYKEEISILRGIVGKVVTTSEYSNIGVDFGDVQALALKDFDFNDFGIWSLGGRLPADTGRYISQKNLILFDPNHDRS